MFSYNLVPAHGPCVLSTLEYWAREGPFVASAYFCAACWGSEARMIAEYRAEVLARRTEREDLIVGRIAHEEPRSIAKQNM